MKKLREMKKNQKGFTLVEVIVVLVILAIMAAILIPSLINYIDKARQNSAQSECRAAVQATQTLSSEAYAKYKTIETIVFDDSTSDASSLSADGKTYTITAKDIKDLSEVEGTITGVAFEAPSGASTAGKVDTLTYTLGSNSCTYDSGVYTNS